MISAKENVGPQKNGIVTRSRSALGDIKNRGFGVYNKEAGTNANTKKGQVGVSSKSSHFITAEEPQKSCDMSIDEGAPKSVIPPQLPVQSELKTFRSGRHAIRSRLLVQETGKKYLDCENEDFGDSATVYPYAEAIFNYLQNRELAVQPMHRDFISSDGEVNPRMRYILINWLVQIHHSYKLQPETLYLCIAILDRYLMVYAIHSNY
ncbi:cyclin B [Clonorchis sinensis]|uniref:Cyclin B n=1 Tax=Clonorchis sinensis TaxID=79923 RepID=G7YFG6_CLOSI|nr:cyclin B [Clonorchis sinensis]